MILVFSNQKIPTGKKLKKCKIPIRVGRGKKMGKLNKSISFGRRKYEISK